MGNTIPLSTLTRFCTRWATPFHYQLQQGSVQDQQQHSTISKGSATTMAHVWSCATDARKQPAQKSHCPVVLGCRIHRLLLCRGERPTPTTSFLDMTLNTLMVWIQQYWSFGEWGVPLYCHRSQVHSGPEG